MGWWGNYLGHNITKEQELDEVRAQINDSYQILEICKRGTAYWLALKKDEQVFVALVLTRKDNGYFMLKIMDETAGPCRIDCPLKIMKLLTPITDSEWANEWRTNVWASHGYEYNVADGTRQKVKVECQN